MIGFGCCFPSGLLSPGHAAPVIKDADTKAWWATIATLAGDDMKAGDSSPAYARAAKVVADRFARAGLNSGRGEWLVPDRNPSRSPRRS